MSAQRHPRKTRLAGQSRQVRAISGVLDTNQQFCSPRPSRRATENALVGLLTSELGKAGLLVASGCQNAAPVDNGSNQLPSVTLGYSGGAVPGLHRSSLFCRTFQQKRPTTNARLREV